MLKALHVLWLPALAAPEKVDLQARVGRVVERRLGSTACLQARPLVGDVMQCCESLSESCWPSKERRGSRIQACCQDLGSSLLSETEALMREEQYQAAAQLALSLKDKLGVGTGQVLKIVEQAMLRHKDAVHERAIKALNWSSLARHHFGLKSETGRDKKKQKEQLLQLISLISRQISIKFC